MPVSTETTTKPSAFKPFDSVADNRGSSSTSRTLMPTRYLRRRVRENSRSAAATDRCDGEVGGLVGHAVRLVGTMGGPAESLAGRADRVLGCAEVDRLVGIERPDVDRWGVVIDQVEESVGRFAEEGDRGDMRGD